MIQQTSIMTTESSIKEIESLRDIVVFNDIDEEYSLLKVKEGEESFNSLDEFFDYVDESYINS